MDKPVTGPGDHIDIDQLDGLIAAAGVDGAREILNAFWGSAGELLDLLSTQLASGDLERAATTAHAIRGMAANVGAARLSTTASDLEIACTDGDNAAAPDLMSETRADFDAAQGWLLDHLRQAS